MKKFSVAIFCLILVAPAAVFTGAALKEPAGEECVKLPILMYHSLLKSRSGKYIVSPADFENDLNALLKEGYTTVFPSEVIAYAEGNGVLPQKPVMITFDDGHYNNMFYGLPVLRKLGCKALISVVGKFTDFSFTSGDFDNPNYSHVTWEEIGELAHSGYFEIGNHTYNMHNYEPRYGITQKYGESDESYKKALCGDVMKLSAKIFQSGGGLPEVFAYPFGKYSEYARDILIDSGFKMLLTCNEGVSTVYKGKKECLYSLKRFNRSGYYRTADVIEKIQK